MRTEVWKKKKILVIKILLLFFCSFLVIQSISFFQKNSSSFDIYEMYSFGLIDEFGHTISLENIPSERNYKVTVSCDQGATGIWDYEAWGPIIKDLTKSRTKCKIFFKDSYTVIAGIKVPVVMVGTGLYEVNHEDAIITYTTDEKAIQNLKLTEYRYAGNNPNNYVNFNNELWRMIGLVNTPEGSRVKLIRNESIGSYAWNPSENNINGGWGINEWSTAKLMNLLNHGGYFNREHDNSYESDFSSNGLMNEAKEMIDTVTWNIGSNGVSSYSSISDLYRLERSSNIGKNCESGAPCNDTVSRTTTWLGMVGLMYPSDYGYATSGGSPTNREFCMDHVSSWDQTNDCKEHDWLYKEVYQWTITPNGNSNYQDASSIFTIVEGGVSNNHAHFSFSVFPNVYLKDSVKIIQGNGSIDSPYIFGFEN